MGNNPAPFTKVNVFNMKKFHKYLSIEKILIYTCILIFASDTLYPQKSKHLRVSFWNVENLFDLDNDPDKNDDEFAINGRKNVTTDIYDLKLKNCGEVLKDLNADILGICEVENRFMLEELNRVYTNRDYSITHYDSPDSRGIDCALLYDEKVFKLLESRPIENILPGNVPTRDIVYVKGSYHDQVLHVFVNHWPSNYGGREKAIPKRAATSDLLENVLLDILETDPKANIILIGDFNEEPTDPNIIKLIDLSNNDRKAKPFVNLMDPLVGREKVGTYVYRGKDNLIDQIIISSGLFDTGPLKIIPGSIEILDLPKYRQQEGKYAHYPFRFWAGNRLLGGYSDHLAISCTLFIDE